MGRRKGELHAPSLPDSDLADDTLKSLADQCRLECARAEKAEAELDGWITGYRNMTAVAADALARAEKAERQNGTAGKNRTKLSVRASHAIKAKTIDLCIDVIVLHRNHGSTDLAKLCSDLRALKTT